jgi:hypothetical protein
MSEALDRILVYVSAFSEGIARCRPATFNAADVQDAYNRLSRLRERYLHEKRNRNFDAIEEQALRKVFEEDRFIKGMLDGRQIGEHVQKTSGDHPVILLTKNSPITLCVETSAGSFFGGPIVTVRDTQEMVYSINHLEQLAEAENRIQRALEHAQKSSPKR